ncbi:MAG: hypothetical protein NTV34_04025, partial [Proteobacteria bacterium]|nr:hypothetical protein [Pseudomonadota bacterium]
VTIAIKASTTNRKTPIFVLSGLVDDQRIQKLTALKVADIILKPFFLDNVAEKIKGVVNPTHKAIGYQRAVIDLFEASASEVLKFYLGDVLRAKDSRIASKSSPLTAAVAIINLFGSIIYGSATFGCNSTFLNRLGEALFAQGNIPTEQLTPFAAEILNQIAGKIKARNATFPSQLDYLLNFRLLLAIHTLLSAPKSIWSSLGQMVRWPSWSLP